MPVRSLASEQNTSGPSVVRLVGLGLLAALCFSSTFVINRQLAIGGGPWFWTAFLRYFYTLLILTLVIPLVHGRQALRATAWCYRRNWKFWTLAGGVGFGCFYSALSYAFSFAPGWIVAATWQLTIIATPLVLKRFGAPLQRRSITYSAVVFLGVLLVNLHSISSANWGELLAIPVVLLAAVCYPIGNTMLLFAKSGEHALVKRIPDEVMSNTLSNVWMMTAGALPVLAVIGAVGRPGPPTLSQVLGIVFVALSTGVVATSIFLYARSCATRNGATQSWKVVAVDATQAAEVPFALALELLLFHGNWPSPNETIGLLLIASGIGLHAANKDAEATPTLEA